MPIVLKKRLSLLAVMSCACFSLLWGATNATANPLKDTGTKFGSTKIRFPIRESGYWTCEGSLTHCIYWLDNDRVIFNGAKPGDIVTTEDRRHVPRHAIYIWDLKTGAVTKHADASRAVLCFSDGYVRYSRVEGENIVVIAGPFGKEIEIQRVRKGEQIKIKPHDHGWNTQLSCHRYKPDISNALPGAKIALKEGHGFIYLGTRSSVEDRDQPVEYFHPPELRKQLLPLARWQLSPSEIHRSDFDDSYLMWGQVDRNVNSTCVRPGFERTIYRLTPDGKLSSIVIPADDRVRCHAYRFALTRVGLLIQAGGGSIKALNVSRSYLLREGRINEVTRGVVTGWRVSPNGCRVALGISSDGDSRKPHTALDAGHLKVIEFCVGDK